ncbi:hypothetical protein [Pseudoxanthomonas sp.]|jgi:hypothetical protein|uniref:hypothetical protein n=1 Tax=Pseudoxanthomonas sp. TaxID=1871049 RepID=UPI002E13CD38|nr:hypothetical protein [Pseudoxanthomonas sp.]
MKLSRFNWFIVILSAALSVFGFWSFAVTLAPIPGQLLTESGTIASAEAHRRKGGISSIRFKVAPSGREFSYPDILKNPEAVWNRIERGYPVVVHYANPDEPELWGLRVSGESLITSSEAYAARRENGYWGLALGFGFFASCLYMLFVEGRRHAA